MKKKYILPVMVAFMLVAVPLGVVYAQTSGGTSISGDEICGSSSSTKCTLADLKIITAKLISFVVALGLPLMTVFVAVRFVLAWFALKEGNASAYKEALAKARDAFIGFIIVILVASGFFFVLLKYLGVKAGFLDGIKLFSAAFIPHAYAQATSTAQVVAEASCDSAFNLLGVCSLYDFLLSVLNMVMKFFVYPGLIIIWVWTGFSFVTAQGNPTALNKAKKWLLWAFVTSFSIFMLQAFIIALRGTIERIAPPIPVSQNAPQQNNTGGGAPSSAPAASSNTGNDGRTAPASGQPGSACNTGTGTIGQRDSNDVCQYGRGGYTDPCLLSRQVHARCVTQDGKDGTCLLSASTNKLVCIPK